MSYSLFSNGWKVSVFRFGFSLVDVATNFAFSFAYVQFDIY